MRRVLGLTKIILKRRVYVNSINHTIHTFSTKADLQLLQKLRQETEISILKAKEALVINKNDYEKALSWVLEDAKTSGIIKAEKLRGRVAKEGLIGVMIHNMINKEGFLSNQRGAIVEVNCETDFVSRNEIFKQFVAQIASTSLLLSLEDSSSSELPTIQNIPLNLLKSSPLLPLPSITNYNHNSNTVEQSIGELIGKLGENITLRRAAVVTTKDSGKENSITIATTGGYVHGGDELTGKIGGLILLQSSGETSQQQQSSQIITKLARNLARQIVGLNPRYINEENNIRFDDGVDDRESFLNENVLMRQTSLWGGGSIRDVMKQTELNTKLQLKVLDFVRWECGEGIEKQETNFAAEVMKQVGMS
ncbi:5576_t:CDS:2 [Ambispora gerdemannii]|uniref:Elongation factor Ts, mitochondrial n=1 Tax=Ambispora gerdemannii TaxID=144530 RepID=A0A9N8V6J7_9GLOM|nr:5576_t:CDS:2 [Ambispora gerdemannii]